MEFDVTIRDVDSRNPYKMVERTFVVAAQDEAQLKQMLKDAYQGTIVGVVSIEERELKR